jgi:hypothetical protein
VHATTGITFLKASDHSFVVIFWIVSACADVWPAAFELRKRQAATERANGNADRHTIGRIISRISFNWRQKKQPRKEASVQ